MTKLERFSHTLSSVMKSVLKILFICIIIFLTYCFILPVGCLKDNVCMKSVKSLHSLLDKGINKKEEYQLNCATKRGTVSNKQNVANSKSNNSYISNILNHTANILSVLSTILCKFFFSDLFKEG